MDPHDWQLILQVLHYWRMTACANEIGLTTFGSCTFLSAQSSTSSNFALAVDLRITSRRILAVVYGISILAWSLTAYS